MLVGMIWRYPHFRDKETDDQKGLKGRKEERKEQRDGRNKGRKKGRKEDQNYIERSS